MLRGNKWLAFGGLAIAGGLILAVVGAFKEVRGDSADSKLPPLPAVPVEQPAASPPTPTDQLAATADLSNAISILKPDFEASGSGNAPAPAALAA